MVVVEEELKKERERGELGKWGERRKKRERERREKAVILNKLGGDFRSSDGDDVTPFMAFSWFFCFLGFFERGGVGGEGEEC